MLLIVIAGLLLCWDAGSSQGCSREESCGGLFSNQISKAFSRKSKHEAKIPQQNKARFVESHVHKEQSLYRDDPTVQFGGAGITPIVQAAVTFNDSVLLVLNPLFPDLTETVRQGDGHQLRCLYARVVRTGTLSVQDGFVRCEHPPYALRNSVTGSVVTFVLGRGAVQQVASDGAVYGRVSWKKVVYEWVPLENEGDALLFVKGLSHSKRSMLPEGLECQYGDDIRTQVVAFCQENVRCKLPPPRSQRELIGKQVTVILKDKIFPSAVRFYPDQLLSSVNSQSSARQQLLPEALKPFYLCACTLVWNGAKFLREWVIYHSHVGVQRFFFYDNNSDDDIVSVVQSLHFYNVSRHPWPWHKTQEASFSHCAIRASSECAWVVFIDLDEFIFPKNYLPPKHERIPEPPLHAMIKQYDAVDMGELGQLKISNFNFGPSGLTMLPESGQMVNYVCRMSTPRRVKSIVRASAISLSYCSRVHHFELKPGFVSAQSFRKDVIIHHYKYQVWADFKMKFVRRAATFVTDWGQNKDLDSFDRTPGLGTEAVEPPDWAHQFCEIEDTALRDYVMNASQLHFESKLLWE